MWSIEGSVFWFNFRHRKNRKTSPHCINFGFSAHDDFFSRHFVFYFFWFTWYGRKLILNERLYKCGLRFTVVLLFLSLLQFIEGSSVTTMVFCEFLYCCVKLWNLWLTLSAANWLGLRRFFDGTFLESVMLMRHEKAQAIWPCRCVWWLCCLQTAFRHQSLFLH